MDPPGRSGAGRSSSVSTGADRPLTAPRTSITLDDSASVPRRPPASHPPGAEVPPQGSRPRRGSTFSVLSEAASRDFQEEIFDPGPALPPDEKHEKPSWSALPLMFAILPPTMGLIFRNGSSFFTDIIVLGLAGVFLHWSVTTPWKWYEAAQQLRVQKEADFEAAIEMGRRPLAGSEHGSDESFHSAMSEADRTEGLRQTETALRQLRVHEVVALAMCFFAPAASTYLFYSLRNMLTGQSESLVSGFNLTIFLLSAEISPMSHAIKLVLNHTLHLQRIVQSSPYKVMRLTPLKYQEMIRRLDALEAQLSSRQKQQQQKGPDGRAGAAGDGVCKCRPQHEIAQQLREVQASAVREARAAVQPEIDALNRAVRRYEKMARQLAQETEGRIGELRVRLDDAIALTAVVARGGNVRRRPLGGRLVAGTVDVVVWAAVRAWYFATMPLRAALESLLGGITRVNVLCGIRASEPPSRPASPEPEPVPVRPVMSGALAGPVMSGALAGPVMSGALPAPSSRRVGRGESKTL